MDNTCKYCGRNQLFIRPSGSNTGLYCQTCGKWQKWMNKNEIRAFNAQNDVLESSDTAYNDIVERLQEFADRLVKEVDKTLTRTPISDTDAIVKCALAQAYEKDKNAILAIINGKRYFEVTE